MKKKLVVLFGLVVVIAIVAIKLFIDSTPSPDYFHVEETLTIKVGETKKFVKDYYPDESILVIKCACEDESIAQVSDNQEKVIGKSEGTTKIICESKGEKISETYLEVTE